MGSSGKATTRRSITSGGFLGGAGASGGGVGPVNPNLQPNVTIQPANQNNPNVQSQVPNAQNTPVTPGAVTALTQMTDDQLAALVNASKRAQMPNYLSDRPDPTQKFVFQAGINEKPMVLDSQAFNQYMQDNNIPQWQVMSRSVNNASYTNQQGYTVNYSSDQIQRMLKYSNLNYIGGKVGGQAYGAGAYFEMNGGGSTGYGSNTATAILNPKAKIIEKWDLMNKANSFDQTHPKFAKAVGGVNNKTLSIYALAMGYQVITSASNGKRKKGEYYNIIDRSALIYQE